MRIEDIDKNMAWPTITNQDVEWKSCREEPFSLHGVIYSEEEGVFRRMTNKWAHAEGLGEGIIYLSRCTSGGRIRFKTNSPYVAIKCVIPSADIMSNMTIMGAFGLSLYVNGNYSGNYTPIWANLLNPIDGLVETKGWFYKEERNSVAFEGLINVEGEGDKQIDLYLPLYSGVKELYIGVKEGSTITKTNSYTYEKPIVFYGSSITQGASASHPGNDYVSVVSRWLDSDYLNLGFSGNCIAQKSMVEYLASLNPSIYVIDYDHNASGAKMLTETHMPLYRAIRKAHPTTPIIFITKPDCDYDKFALERKAVIYNTYQTALNEGDKNVDFIDGKELFGTEDRELCTADKCHPNDLGFYRMAKVIEPVLRKWIEK